MELLEHKPLHAHQTEIARLWILPLNGRIVVLGFRPQNSEHNAQNWR
jgi:hypothetical protein